MLQIDIEAGKPITPLPGIRVPRTGYVAIIPREAGAGDLFTGFVDWLVNERPTPANERTPHQRMHAPPRSPTNARPTSAVILSGANRSRRTWVKHNL